MKERKEVEEAKEVKEKSGGVAAFFDLDGTLMALPSLEQRFFRMLRYRRVIGAKNYFLWLKEALRLMPRGISAIFQANKMYLRGVQTFDELGEGDGNFSSSRKSGHQAQGQASTPPRRNPRLPVLVFFPRAIERVAWHARQGHTIVLVSGTLEPLALGAARALEAKLAAHGIAITIHVCATRLEELHGKYTGRVLGEAMFGEAKARAAKKLAQGMRLNLAQCSAYGDSANDRWLLSVAGNPTAVNPSPRLARIAKEHRWALLRWNKETELTQRTQSSRSAQRSPRSEKKSKDTSVEKSAPGRAERCA